MSDMANVLVIVAVIALVLARQIRPRRVGGGRWWLVPALLAVLGIRDGGLIDGQHHAAAVTLLGAELVIAAVMGAVWAGTIRMWRQTDGQVMAQGTKVTLGVWALGIAARVALYAVAAANGVHQTSSTVMIAVAETLLIRGGVLVWRAQGIAASYRTAS